MKKTDAALREKLAALERELSEIRGALDGKQPNPGSQRFPFLPLLSVLLILLLTASPTSTESVTLTTYYPAPAGVYNNMVTIGNTWLARDSLPAPQNTSFVEIGGNSPTPSPNAKLVVLNGDVGISTASPQAALDVNGVVRVGNMAPPYPTPVAGGILYDPTANGNSGTFLGASGSPLAWGPLNGAPIPTGLYGVCTVSTWSGRGATTSALAPATAYQRRCGCPSGYQLVQTGASQVFSWRGISSTSDFYSCYKQ